MTETNHAGDSGRPEPPTPPTAAFTLPNGGPGPDPLTLSELDATLAVVLFFRDRFSGTCRRRAVRMARNRDAFRERDVAVVSVLPESKAVATAWADARDVPLPTLADTDGETAARYGQPTRFGRLGRRIDLLGRMPLTALVDLRAEPEILWRYGGETADDWPTVETLLTEVEKFA